MISENRRRALKWWNNLTNEEKTNFFNGYSLYTPAKDHTQLTGREVQRIWAVQESK